MTQQTLIRKKGGRCGSGLEGGSGIVYHAISEDAFWPWCASLCGTKPGRLSAGWVEGSKPGSATCKPCLKKLSQGGV